MRQTALFYIYLTYISMIDIQNRTRSSIPNIPFEEIARATLGAKYELSLVFIGDTRSQKLNIEHRGKNKPTNILSFPLSDTDGEIFINLNLAYKEAPTFKRSKTNFIAFLFIHGLHHLKGLDHGSTMERKEESIRAKFAV